MKKRERKREKERIECLVNYHPIRGKKEKRKEKTLLQMCYLFSTVFNGQKGD